MCVVCWQEFDDCSNPPVDLGCGHYGCGSCLSAISSCPVCNATVTTSADNFHGKSRKVEGSKTWPAPRRKNRTGEVLLGDLLDDDHLTPSVLGSADAASSPRVRMLERAPSSAAGSVTGRVHQGVALSARHVAHGGVMAGRTMLHFTVVPAARAGVFVGKSLVCNTFRAAAATSRALAFAACSLARFASAPRCSISGFDGSHELDPCMGDPSEAQSRQQPRGAPAPPPRGRRTRRPLQHQRGGCIPEPISNVVRGRITLRDSRNTRIRIEYCRDCVIVASRLEAVEVMLVCCQRVKLVLRDCKGLVLRELQCTDMGDFVRRDCPNFVHEIVCLRCACKPMTSSFVTY